MPDEHRRPFTPPPIEPPPTPEEPETPATPEPPAPPPQPPTPPVALTAEASLNAALSAWQEYMRREGLSEHTVRAFSSDLRILARYAGPGTAIGSFTTQGLNDFLRWDQTGRGVRISPKTYARRITAIKSFFRWLITAGVLSFDPAEPVIQHSVQSPLPEYLHPDEVERAEQAALLIRQGAAGKKPDIRPFLLFHLLLQTGIKKGECLSLIPEHIDLSNPAEPFLFVRYASPRQRLKERKLRLTPDWVATYREYLAEYQPDNRVFPWSPRRLEYMLEDIGKVAGLDKRLSFDCLRWTCAVRDREAGMEADKIRQKLGLSKIQWREVGSKLERLTAEPL
jgi:site-specific recombinase XerD